jgi:tetratricopeptide (TPR) repeat protein
MLPQRRLSHAQGYLGLGMVAEAAAELEQLSESEADTPAAVAVRLAVLHGQHDWPALRDLAGRLIGRGQADAGIWVTWAYATRRADSLAAAEAILTRAEQLHPEEPTIQFNLGCYASLRGDLRTARRRVARAIALDGEFAALAATDPDLAALRAADAATDCQPGV